MRQPVPRLARLVAGLLFLVAPTAFAQSSVFYPTIGTFGTWAFEDQWPLRGDYDFNDLVVQYRLQFVTTSSAPDSAVQQVKVTVRPMARGASWMAGFGVRLPIPASVEGLTARFGPGCSWEPLTSEGGLGDVSFRLFEDAAAALPLPDGCVFTNTDPSCVGVTNPREFTLVVDLPQGHGIPLATLLDGVDPFLFRVTDRAHEVHLAGFAPTAQADPARFGTGDDATTCVWFEGTCVAATGHYYLTQNNLPWAVDVPVAWLWPKETTSVLDAFPQFAAWATTAGRDPGAVAWYTDHPVAGTGWSGVLTCQDVCAQSACLGVACPTGDVCHEASVCEDGTCGPREAVANFTPCDTDRVCIEGACLDVSSPEGVPGLVAWFDASVGMTTDGVGKVSAWTDRTGHGHDVVQTTESLRPTQTGDGIYFDGVLKYLRNTKPINIGTAVLKVKLEGTVFLDSYPMFFMNATCSPSWAMYGLYGIGNSTSIKNLVNGYVPFRNAWMRVDGVTTTNVFPFAGEHVISGRSDPIALFGALELGGGGVCAPAYPMKGYMQHALFFDRVLSEAELLAVETYLMAL